MDEIPPGVNDSRRPDPRRDAADELAERLATDDGLREARLAHLAGLTERPAATPPDPAPTAGPRPISIWQPRDDGDALVFVRPPVLPLGDHYAARREIPARKAPGTRRVAFFGESVAAGYLYAPHLTPAQVLETQLARVSGESWDVVDLARTNETLDGLAATVEAALRLEPDVLVVFAGNNWNLLETPDVSPWAPSVEARQRYALALAGGLDGPVSLARRQLEGRATATLESLAELAAAARAPVVVVVPEVNLADWESRQPVPWLPGDATPRWWQSFDAANAALAAGRTAEAAALAEAMAELDGGAVGTAFRLLARAASADGRPADARRWAEAEVDHTPYATLAFLDAPRATGAVKDLLRRAALRHGFTAVDLPRLFAELEPCPGRRFFLDYCHLSAEGIALAMAATASAVLGTLTGRDVAWREIAPLAPEVAPEVEATACLGAAVHGAHRLLTTAGPRPILGYWLRRALEAHPEAARAMRELAAARAVPAPAILTAAQASNHAGPCRLLLQHGWRWDFLDAELVLEIAATLDDADAVAQGFVDGLGLDARGVELCCPPFLWEPLERFYPEVMDFADLDLPGTLRSPWPRTRFCLVQDGETDVVLELTARRPWTGGEAAVRVNGRPAGRFAVSERFVRHRLRAPRHLWRRGLNRVSVHWPTLPPAGDDALAAVRRRLELGRSASLHPVFGELRSLRATPARGL